MAIPQDRALDSISRALDGLAVHLATNEEAATHFTCTEADGIAYALITIGHVDFARQFLTAHAKQDDDADTHGDIHNGTDAYRHVMRLTEQTIRSQREAHP